jgi:hypothetical protein
VFPGRPCSGRLDGTSNRSQAARWSIEPVPSAGRDVIGGTHGAGWTHGTGTLPGTLPGGCRGSWRAAAARGERRRKHRVLRQAAGKHSIPRKAEINAGPTDRRATRSMAGIFPHSTEAAERPPGQHPAQPQPRRGHYPLVSLLSLVPETTKACSRRPRPKSGHAAGKHEKGLGSERGLATPSPDGKGEKSRPLRRRSCRLNLKQC